MKITRIILFLMMALMSWSVCDATEKPLFSNEAEEHWYYVYYENLSHVFQENGEIDGYWNDPTDSNNNVTFIPYDDVKEPLDMSGIKEFAVNGRASYVPANRATLWYTTPVTAEKVDDPWMEYALPIGNGEFGAMVYGGVHCEQLQFNDKSVWTGTSTRRGSYQNFGDLFIEDISGVFESGSVENYVRYLDMKNATAGVSYSGAGVNYTREYISSYPAKVIAVRLAADKISFPTVAGGEYSITLADPSGVESVEMAVAGGPVEYFDLSGRRIAAGSLTPGIYIRRIGTTAEKIKVR